MMKDPSTAKRISVAVLLLAAVMTLTACFSSPIEATWTLSSVGGTGSTSSELATLLSTLKSLGLEVNMTFKSGSVTLSAPGYDSQKFTYSLSGNKKTLTIDAISTVCTWAVSGNTLTIDYSGSHLVLTKKT